MKKVLALVVLAGSVTLFSCNSASTDGDKKGTDTAAKAVTPVTPATQDTAKKAAMPAAGDTSKKMDAAKPADAKMDAAKPADAKKDAAKPAEKKK